MKHAASDGTSITTDVESIKSDYDMNDGEKHYDRDLMNLEKPSYMKRDMIPDQFPDSIDDFEEDDEEDKHSGQGLIWGGPPNFFGVLCPPTYPFLLHF